VHGSWEKDEGTCRDNLTRFFVDVPDLPENRRFIQQFKQILQHLFHPGGSSNYVASSGRALKNSCHQVAQTTYLVSGESSRDADLKTRRQGRSFTLVPVREKKRTGTSLFQNLLWTYQVPESL